MNYYSVSYGDCLQHHGVNGQKWGVKNGPPYPLSPSDHSASEKKAGWQDSLEPSARARIDGKKVAKVVASVAVTAAVATGAVLAIKNGTAVNAFIKSYGNAAISSFKANKGTQIKNGAEAAKKVLKGTMKATKETIKSVVDPIGPREDPGEKAYRVTKRFLGTIMNSARENIPGGGKSGINRGFYTVGTGLGMLGVKELSDIVLGKNLSGKAYKANDKKKIGSFWTYEENNKGD